MIKCLYALPDVGVSPAASMEDAVLLKARALCVQTAAYHCTTTITTTNLILYFILY